MNATHFFSRIRLYLLFPFLGMLISCSPIVQGGPQGELDRARTQWRALGSPANYSYHYQSICYCPREIVQPVIITVHNRMVSSVVYADSGVPVDPEYLSHYKTVEQLFEILQEAIDRDAFQMNVTYDPAFGYPSTAYINHSEQMADEELRFTADSLRVL